MSEQETSTMDQMQAPQAHETQDAAKSDAGERLVPVSEAIRYRKRAQSAEQRLDELQHRLSSANDELEETKKAIDRLERRQKVDAMLAESQAVDLEVARLLTEAAVEMMDEPDVQAAIDDLRRSKPWLFRQRAAATASAMPARTMEVPHETHEAARQALSSGNRRDLLRYLRLRRVE